MPDDAEIPVTPEMMSPDWTRVMSRIFWNTQTHVFHDWARKQAAGAVDATPIPVTPEMIAAGRAAVEGKDAGGWDADVTIVYRAMAALAPARDAETTLTVAPDMRLVEERNAACRERDYALHLTDLALGELDKMSAKLAAFNTPALVPGAPAPNPFREFGDDRRRVGG